MTTTLDIIDTAVKIGLGALISGITTYLVTGRNIRQEKTKAEADYSRDILKELSLAMEQSTSLLNEFVHTVSVTNEANENSTALLFKSKNSGTHSEALAILIGCTELAQKISAYHNHINELISEFYDLKHYNLDKCTEIVDQINSTRDEIPSLISAAYWSISA